MANTKTLLELRTESRQRADQENSDFISDAELTGYINASYGEWYDIIVSRFEDYFTLDVELTIASGSSTLTLPTDFHKLRGVDFKLSNNDFYNLQKFNFNQRNVYSNRNLTRIATNRFNRVYRIIGSSDVQVLPEDNAPGTYKLWYVPIFTPLVSDSDTVNGYNGWEEYIIVDAAIKMMQKEESDVSVLMVQKQALLERIQSAAQNRDFDGIETVTDSSLNNISRSWGSF